MRRFVIGTAGHVDHGKTTLVRALTGVDTDRLPEEKRRGISIELGFAPFDLGEGLVASVVDVPGHRRLVRTMIAGASGMELVMLVVAADEGVMPQTREHVAVCELLGVTRAVVVVTKADAVDADLAAVACEEARALLGDRWTAEVVTCSARSGAGLEDVRTALRRALRALPPPAKREHVRLGVDRVFTARGAVIMPKMRGPELAGKVTELRPFIKILFMSGYIDDASIGGAVTQPGVALLAEPFTPDALAHKVRELLGKGTASPA